MLWVVCIWFIQSTECDVCVKMMYVLDMCDLITIGVDNIFVVV